MFVGWLGTAFRLAAPSAAQVPAPASPVLDGAAKKEEAADSVDAVGLLFDFASVASLLFFFGSHAL